MYDSFYGLKTKPFSLLPDPDFLYLGKKHKVALALLEYALMNHAGFCVITGEIGAGKTTLLRKLLDSIEDNYTVGMITNTHQSFGELLDWVLSAYGIHQPGLGKVEMHQRLVDFLLEQYANNKSTLLIVDEAQNMSAATLEELRMLSNINSEKDLVLQVILAGQPGLRDTLKKPELMQFVQRISVDYHLDALNSGETCSYIQHRLVTAGATEDIFMPEACMLIHEYSGGVPRLINLLCDTALVYGFADQKKIIGVDIIEEMVKERMENSILPLAKINRSNIAEKTNNEDFPWISPNGGTEGLKPVGEKKTVEIDVSESEQTKDDSSSEYSSTLDAVQDEPVITEAEVPVVIEAIVKSKIEDISNIPEPVTDETSTTDYPEEIEQALMPDDVNEPPLVNQASTVENAVSEPGAVEPEKSRVRTWGITAAVAVLAVLISISTGLLINKDAELTDVVKSRLAEVEKMKQDLERMQQQAEVMQRERDAALAKAQQEEELRAQEAQAALEAANREREAMAAAALAAEKALKATKEAEELAIKQRLEEKRLRDERKRLQLEKRQAELEQQRLEQERRQDKLEKERLELDRAKKQKLEQQERERMIAKEQAELFKSLEENESAKAAAKKKSEQKTKTKESSFNTDPCSSPSAKFLSTCR